jgi:hypothetical protein
MWSSDKKESCSLCPKLSLCKVWWILYIGKVTISNIKVWVSENHWNIKMKPGPLVNLSSRLKRSHPVTSCLSVHVWQLPAMHRRPERRRPRARHRLSPPATCPLGVDMRRASILIAQGLSSKPSPFPSPREATLPPCSASRSTLPLVASADDRAVSAASGCACGCPHPQAGAMPRRTPERPNAIIRFGCPPTIASSEPPPPSSAASSHELPPPPTSRAPHRSGAPHRPLWHHRATTGPFSHRWLSSAQAHRHGEPLSGEPLHLDAPQIGPPPHRVALAATSTPLTAGKLLDLGGSAIARHRVPCFGSGLPAHGGLGQMVGLARFGPMEQFLAISRNLFESSSI